MASAPFPTRIASNAAIGTRYGSGTSTNPDSDPADRLPARLPLEHASLPESYAPAVAATVSRLAMIRRKMTRKKITRRGTVPLLPPQLFPEISERHPPPLPSTPRSRSSHTSGCVQIQFVVFLISVEAVLSALP